MEIKMDYQLDYTDAITEAIRDNVDLFDFVGFDNFLTLEEYLEMEMYHEVVELLDDEGIAELGLVPDELDW